MKAGAIFLKDGTRIYFSNLNDYLKLTKEGQEGLVARIKEKYPKKTVFELDSKEVKKYGKPL